MPAGLDIAFGMITQDGATGRVIAGGCLGVPWIEKEDAVPAPGTNKAETLRAAPLSQGTFPHQAKSHNL